MDQDKTASDSKSLKECTPSNGVFGIENERGREVASRIKRTIASMQLLRCRHQNVSDMSRTFWLQEPYFSHAEFVANELEDLVYDIHVLTGVDPVEIACNLLVSFRQELRKDGADKDRSDMRTHIWIVNSVKHNSVLVHNIARTIDLYQANTLYSALMQLRFV